MQQTRTSHVGARSSMGQTCMPRMRPFAPHSIRQATQQLCCSTLPASAAPCTVVGRSAIAASAVAAPAMAFAPRQHRRAVVRARSAPTDNMPSPTPLVAVEGDLILVHFVCKDADGNVLESSIEADSPLSFVIGAGEMMGNKLFQGFDEAVRGLAIGDTTELEAQGGDWDRNLLFTVPRNHPEIERLEGRYKNLGGLKEGLVVELANGNMALVAATTPEAVTLDANNMMAGKTLTFTLTLVDIQRAD